MPDKSNKNWKRSGVSGLMANTLMCAMPYLPNLTWPSAAVALSQTKTPLEGVLHSAGAMGCIASDGIKTFLGDKERPLKVSCGILLASNIAFFMSGCVGNHPFTMIMGVVGGVSALLQQMGSHNKLTKKIKGPKAASVLDGISLTTQIGNAVTQGPYWAGVFIFNAAKTIFQAKAPAVDALQP